MQPFMGEETRDHEREVTEHAINDRIRLDSRASVKRTIDCGFPRGRSPSGRRTLSRNDPV